MGRTPSCVTKPMHVSPRGGTGDALACIWPSGPGLVTAISYHIYIPEGNIFFARKAKEKQIEHGGAAPGKSKSETLLQNSAEVISPIDTREELAKIARVSHDTIMKVDFGKYT